MLQLVEHFLIRKQRFFLLGWMVLQLFGVFFQVNEVLVEWEVLYGVEWNAALAFVVPNEIVEKQTADDVGDAEIVKGRGRQKGLCQHAQRLVIANNPDHCGF